MEMPLGNKIVFIVEKLVCFVASNLTTFIQIFTTVDLYCLVFMGPAHARSLATNNPPFSPREKGRGMKG